MSVAIPEPIVLHRPQTRLYGWQQLAAATSSPPPAGEKYLYFRDDALRYFDENEVEFALLTDADFAAPPALGSTTPAAVTGTTGRFNNDLTLAGAPGKIKPAANSTTALQIAQADGTAFATFDTTNGRMGLGLTPTARIDIKPPSPVATVAFRVERSDSAATVFTIDGEGKALMNFLGVGAAPSTTYQSQVLTGSPSRIAQRISGASGQSVNFFEIGISAVLYMTVGSTGLVTHTVNDAVTNAISPAMTIGHDTSGTAAAGFGSELLWALESSTTAAQNAAKDEALWNVATHASRMGQRRIGVYDVSTLRYGLDIVAISGAVQIGLYGVTPVSRAAHIADPSGGGTQDAEARTAINAILVALENIGITAAA